MWSCEAKRQQDSISRNHDVYTISFSFEGAKKAKILNQDLANRIQFKDSITTNIVNSTIKTLDSLAMILLINGAVDIDESNFTKNYQFKGHIPSLSTIERSDYKDLIHRHFPNLKGQLNKFPDHLNTLGFDTTFRIYDAMDDPIYAMKYADNPTEAPTFIDVAFSDKNLRRSLTVVYNIEVMVQEEYRRYLQSQIL